VDPAPPASSFAFPAEFQTAIEAIPAGPPDADLESPDAIATRANQRFAAGDYAQAAVLYERLIGMDPMNVPLLNNLGITLHYLGRSDEALQWLEHGVAIDPAHQRSWLTIGFINSQVGNTDEARTALNEAFRLGADNDIGMSAARMLRDMGFEVTLD
jgi:tetratricopeptide (TPR) repeat protein